MSFSFVLFAKIAEQKPLLRLASIAELAHLDLGYGSSLDVKVKEEEGTQLVVGKLF